MNTERIVLKGRIITPFTMFSGEIMLKDGLIEDLTQGSFGKDDQVVDYGDCYICPGFFDLHLHGAVGYDFMDGDIRGFSKISRFLAGSGVTGFLATTMTMAKANIRSAVKATKEIIRDHIEASPVCYGMHLEGPYVNEEYIGAQNPKYILSGEDNFLAELIEEYGDMIKTVTLAPEIKGGEELIKDLVSHGIYPSAGHTGASLVTAGRAFDLGVNRVTHLFNAMPPIHHRAPGIITGALLDDRVFTEVIADGIHIHRAVVEMIIRIKGASGVCLVTDSMRATGLPDGRYDLGGQEVVVKGEEARLADGRLAGSVLSMDRAVRNIIEFTKAPLEDVIRMASFNPARAVGLDKICGSLEKGKQADIVVLSKELEVLMTMVRGNIVYQR